MAATTNINQRLERSSAIASRLIQNFADLMLIMLFTSYRPELHYVRGPGPRWHAKNDQRGASLDGVLGDVKDENYIGTAILNDLL
jgi:hypothetical protein